MTVSRRTPPRRRSNLTGRAAVLALVVCALVLALAYPFRQYLGQRQRIAELRADVVARQERVAALEAQSRRWQDPAFVKAQARQRLHFVMPGETAYIVLDGTDARRAQAAPKPPDGPTGPWWDGLWGSVQRADRTGAAAPARR